MENEGSSRQFYLILTTTVALLVSHAVCLIGGFQYGRATHPSPHADGLYEVRLWLRNNLPDPNWEEIKFWPLRRVDEYRRDTIVGIKSNIKHNKEMLDKARLAQNADDIELYESIIRNLEDQLKKNEARLPPTLCRLKFRSKNKHGGVEIFDHIFGIQEGGSAVECLTHPEKWSFVDDEKKRAEYVTKEFKKYSGYFE